MKNHLICYDIANPKRLGRVHRLCKRYAMPLQYSVFLAELNASRLEELVRSLEAIIDQNEDDIRIYPLHNGHEALFIGQAKMPEGVYIGSEGGMLDQLMHHISSMQ